MGLSVQQAAALLLAPFVGSFLSVLVVRLPVARPVVVARSCCPACEHRLGPLDLLPLLSWLFCGGRCRYCAVPVSPFYPGVEIAAVAVALWAGWVVDGWLLWISCTLGWTLLALALCDLRKLILPDVLTLPLLPLGLAVAFWLAPAQAVHHLIGALAGFFLLYAINKAYRYLRGREGLGLGDAKLLAGAGAWLGWAALPSVVLLATMVALCAVAVARLAGRRFAASDAFPFGSALALAFWVVWLHGPLS